MSKKDKKKNEINKKLVNWAVKVARDSYHKGEGAGLAAHKAWKGVREKNDITADEIRRRLMSLFNAN